jgi:ubiquinone/menaquinone biosynthesis C-methylase UbiE
MNRAYKRRLAWSFLAVGAATAAPALALRHQRRKLDAEATRLPSLLNIAPGATVTEIGAGKGQMTVRVARQVQPGGRVLSTEFEPKKLR